jgi:hypothetical protein
MGLVRHNTERLANSADPASSAGGLLRAVSSVSGPFAQPPEKALPISDEMLRREPYWSSVHQQSSALNRG